jgi:hypothetical protein
MQEIEYAYVHRVTHPLPLEARYELWLFDGCIDTGDVSPYLCEEHSVRVLVFAAPRTAP